MEIFLKLTHLCPLSFNALSKLVTDVIDKIASVLEYLYPDFGV